jgi:Prion-inhibition and propagation
MAEVAATAIGIAGVVSVLQNLLQCYKDFTTARDFPRSLTTLVLQAALIDNSTRSWAEAVGLIDHSGAPLSTFLIERPTEKNAKLAARTLTHIQELMNDANEALDGYHSGLEGPAHEDVGSNSAKEEENESRRRKILQKLSRATLCTRTQESSSMIVRRVTWALLDKENLEKKLAEVTTLLDRLNTDFRPKSPEIQMMVYHSSLQSLGIENEEMQLIASVAVDKVSRSVAASAMKEQATGTTGNTFERIVLNRQATLHQGDFVAPDYVISGAENLLASKNIFKIIEGSDQTLISIGNQYGGKSPMEMMHERMTAAMAASLAMNTVKPPSKRSEEAGFNVKVSEIAS